MYQKKTRVLLFKLIFAYLFAVAWSPVTHANLITITGAAVQTDHDAYHVKYEGFDSALGDLTAVTWEFVVNRTLYFVGLEEYCGVGVSCIASLYVEASKTYRFSNSLFNLYTTTYVAKKYVVNTDDFNFGIPELVEEQTVGGASGMSDLDHYLSDWQMDFSNDPGTDISVSGWLAPSDTIIVLNDEGDLYSWFGYLRRIEGPFGAPRMVLGPMYNVSTKVTYNYNAAAEGDAVSSVPEPSTLAIFTLSMMGLVLRRFKKQA